MVNYPNDLKRLADSSEARLGINSPFVNQSGISSAPVYEDERFSVYESDSNPLGVSTFPLQSLLDLLGAPLDDSENDEYVDSIEYVRGIKRNYELLTENRGEMPVAVNSEIQNYFQKFRGGTEEEKIPATLLLESGDDIPVQLLSYESMKERLDTEDYRSFHDELDWAMKTSFERIKSMLDDTGDYSPAFIPHILLERDQPEFAGNMISSAVTTPELIAVELYEFPPGFDSESGRKVKNI